MAHFFNVENYKTQFLIPQLYDTVIMLTSEHINGYLTLFNLYNSTNPYGQVKSVWKANQSNAQQTPNGSIAKRRSARRGPHERLHQQHPSSIQKTRLEKLSEYLSAELDPAFIKHSVSNTTIHISRRISWWLNDIQFALSGLR